MASWARPGVKVVCVNADAGTGHKWSGDGPVVGAVYTIRSVFIGPTGGLSMDFLELRRGQRARERYGDLIGYWVDRFRPLVSQSDDVALFTHHLDTTKLPERV